MNSSHLLKEFIEGLMNYGVMELKREAERGARAKLLSAALHGIRALKTACGIIVAVIFLTVTGTYCALSLAGLYFAGNADPALLFFYGGCLVLSLAFLSVFFRERFWLKVFKIESYMKSLQDRLNPPSPPSMDREAILLAIDRIVESRLEEKLAKERNRRTAADGREAEPPSPLVH